MAKNRTKQKNKKRIIIEPVRTTKHLELQYQKELMKFGRTMVHAVRAELLPFLKQNQSEYVLDAMSGNLGLIFERLNREFAGTIAISFSKRIAERAIGLMNRTSENNFERALSKGAGVDLRGIITGEGLEDFVNLSIQKNVSLIKSLPEEYFKQIETIVNNGVVSGARYSTIAKQITAMTGSANSKLANRIKTIARNETQTITAQLNIRRSQNLGITKGIYMTSEDEKVRPCHRELDGVEFELKKGAYSKSCQEWIIPGVTDINCRCSYSPVIEIEE